MLVVVVGGYSGYSPSWKLLPSQPCAVLCPGLDLQEKQPHLIIATSVWNSSIPIVPKDDGVAQLAGQVPSVRCALSFLLGHISAGFLSFSQVSFKSLKSFHPEPFNEKKEEEVVVDEGKEEGQENDHPCFRIDILLTKQQIKRNQADQILCYTSMKHQRTFHRPPNRPLPKDSGGGGRARWVAVGALANPGWVCTVWVSRLTQTNPPLGWGGRGGVIELSSIDFAVMGPAALFSRDSRSILSIRMV